LIVMVYYAADKDDQNTEQKLFTLNDKFSY